MNYMWSSVIIWRTQQYYDTRPRTTTKPDPAPSDSTIIGAFGGTLPGLLEDIIAYNIFLGTGKNTEKL